VGTTGAVSLPPSALTAGPCIWRYHEEWVGHYCEVCERWVDVDPCDILDV
jgi:hypothetical protein